MYLINISFFFFWALKHKYNLGQSSQPWCAAVIRCTSTQSLLYGQPAHLKPEWFLVPLKLKCWHLTEGRPFLERLSWRNRGNWSAAFGRREVLVPNSCEREHPIKLFTSNLRESHWKSRTWKDKELSWNLCAAPQGIFNGRCSHSIHTTGFLFLPSWRKHVSRAPFQTGWPGRPVYGSELAKWITSFKEVFSTYHVLLLLTIQPINFNKAVVSNYKSPSLVTLSSRSICFQTSDTFTIWITSCFLTSVSFLRTSSSATQLTRLSMSKMWVA